jgi:hypothetical protein
MFRTAEGLDLIKHVAPTFFVIEIYQSTTPGEALYFKHDFFRNRLPLCANAALRVGIML